MDITVFIIPGPLVPIIPLEIAFSTIRLATSIFTGPISSEWAGWCSRATESTAPEQVPPVPPAVMHSELIIPADWMSPRISSREPSEHTGLSLVTVKWTRPTTDPTVSTTTPYPLISPTRLPLGLCTWPFQPPMAWTPWTLPTTVWISAVLLPPRPMQGS